MEGAVRERCNCPFSSSAIHAGEFSCQFARNDSNCNHASHVIYRGMLNGSSNMLSADQLIEHIHHWRATAGTLLYGNILRLKVASSEECRVKIESFEDEECTI